MAQGHSGINLTQTLSLWGSSVLLIVLCSSQLFKGLLLEPERVFDRMLV